jgi:S-adenosylmethionine decarboxylase
MLVDITGRPSLRCLPAESPLLRDGAGLDSQTGVHLLAAVYERYGVDVAAEDPGLGALTSLRALARFLVERTVAAGSPPDPAGASPPAHPKTLYVVDATAGGREILTDIADLAREVRAAVTEAGGHVLAGSHVVFPNGAVTLVMILAESHVSIHTWPEERLVALDLFSCGAIDGRAVLARLARTLDLTEVKLRQVPRG